MTSDNQLLGLQVELRSATGPHRTTNQDSAAAAADFAAVADGVGGHAGGDVASRAVVRLISARLSDHVAADLDDDTLRALGVEANAALAELARDPGLTGLATTLTALFCDRREVRVVHIGDSRAYLAHGGQGARITRDDSYVQMLIDAGVLDDEQAWHHPNRNLLTQVLDGSTTSTAQVSVARHALELGDRWLVCSDGLTDTLEEADVLAMLVDPAAIDAIADRLLSAALAADPHDNVTVAVCEVVAVDASAQRSIQTVGAAVLGESTPD